MEKVTIRLALTEQEALDLSQLVKRLARRSLGKDDLNLVTPEEEHAEAALFALRDSLAEAGYAPR
jgi:hypothetical protein